MLTFVRAAVTGHKKIAATLFLKIHKLLAKKRILVDLYIVQCFKGFYIPKIKKQNLHSRNFKMKW